MPMDISLENLSLKKVFFYAIGLILTLVGFVNIESVVVNTFF